MSEQLTPFYEDVQSIYDDDHSTDLVSLFLDESMVYSCAYFEQEDYTLNQAQLAKLDLALGKCELTPGMTLLDIGCGWGASPLRALQKFDVNVIALTLSKGQAEYTEKLLQREYHGSRKWEVRVQGWEEFEGSIDRILSIGAFEHFRQERHDAFFAKCRRLLPNDGKMLLHCITWPDAEEFYAAGREVTHEAIIFGKFIRDEVFPGGMLEQPYKIINHAKNNGLECTRRHSLRLHYARTLDCWSKALEERRAEAIAMTSQKVYDRYQKYLMGCAQYFRSGHIDLNQFSLKCV